VTSPEQALDALRQQFVRRTRDDLHVLERHRLGERLTPQQLHLMVHRLAGAGGTFGFPDVSTRAADLETELLDGGDAIGFRLDDLLSALASATRNDRET
jgi:HPt (histidine-containing phosphotransfer) domain-containing protein